MKRIDRTANTSDFHWHLSIFQAKIKLNDFSSQELNSMTFQVTYEPCWNQWQKTTQFLNQFYCSRVKTWYPPFISFNANSMTFRKQTLPFLEYHRDMKPPDPPFAASCLQWGVWGFHPDFIWGGGNVQFTVIENQWWS